MSNRLYTQFRYGFEKKMVDLYCVFAVGSTGACTLTASKSRGIASIARNSAGNYTITLNDRFAVGLYGAYPTVILSSGAPITSNGYTMVVRTDNSAAAAKTVIVGFLKADGTAGDIVTGSTVIIKLELRDATVN